MERFILRTMARMLSRRANGGKVPPDSLGIIPFSGYGANTGFHFQGRVVEKSGIVRMERRDLFFHNAYKMLKRFLTRPASGVTVKVRFDSVQKLVTTTEQGFFRADLEVHNPLSTGGAQRVNIEVVDPRPRTPIEAVGAVFVPPKDARVGIISDIDDTIIHAYATRPLKMFRSLMFANASTRLPFSGVKAFYRALHEGQTGRDRNPFFYISSSSWQMYDVIQDFLHIHDLPPGPIFLRELACTGSVKDPWRHAHKFMWVREILEAYPGIPFVLIGDSGQRDAEIYSLAVRTFPGRIPAVYIRDVVPTKPRRKRISQLAARVKEMGSELVLVVDTMAAALHVASKGWISETLLSDVEKDRVEGKTCVSEGAGKAQKTPMPPQRAWCGPPVRTEQPRMLAEGRDGAMTKPLTHARGPQWFPGIQADGSRPRCGQRMDNYIPGG